MHLIFFFFVLIGFTQNSWSAASNAATYQLSVTLPDHVMLAAASKTTQTSPLNDAQQLVQSDRSIRDNQPVMITSIVAR